MIWFPYFHEDINYILNEPFGVDVNALNNNVKEENAEACKKLLSQVFNFAN